MKKSMITLSTAALLSTTFVSPALANSYTVKQGDTLTKIAREHNTTVQNLKKWNNLKSDFLQINQKLIVSNTSTASLASVTLKKENTSTYTIVAGDTLLRIANKHNITLAELMKLNNLTSDRIYAGDTLIVSKETVNTVVDLPTAKTSTTKPSTATGTYTVVKGDTLSKIALQYKTTVAELKKLNSLTSDLLQIGQKLKIPSISTDKNSTSNAQKTSTNSSSSTTYTVVQGDTLSKIASQYKTSVSELKKLNSLSSDLLQIGQKLKVPASSESGTNTNQIEKEPAPSASINIDTLLKEAKKLIGTPYSWAGSTPSGFDCSGFIYYTMKLAGYEITRLSSSTYYDLGKKVSNPRPGDFVYFATGSNPAVISHMGIYLGNNEFIHASSSSGVRIDSVNSSYYKPRLIGYNRIAN